jgi:hypothetical protein
LAIPAPLVGFKNQIAIGFVPMAEKTNELYLINATPILSISSNIPVDS